MYIILWAKSTIEYFMFGIWILKSLSKFYKMIYLSMVTLLKYIHWQSIDFKIYSIFLFKYRNKPFHAWTQLTIYAKGCIKTYSINNPNKTIFLDQTLILKAQSLNLKSHYKQWILLLKSWAPFLIKEKSCFKIESNHLKYLKRLLLYPLKIKYPNKEKQLLSKEN